MEQRRNRGFQRLKLVAALGILALGAAGVWCWRGPGYRPSATEAPADIRGKPIRSAAPAVESESAALPLPAKDMITPPAAEVKDGYQTVGFDKLASFTFDMPDEPAATNSAPVAAPKDQIPVAIKALNNERVALKGFMLPLKVESGLVTEMLIMRDQSMCCYGTVPKITEWVSVKMNSEGVKPIMDQPVTLFGKLNVGEMRENGYLVGIYQMSGDKMKTDPP